MTTLTITPHRELILRHLQSGDPYQFITLAEPYLETCPNDTYVRLMTIRAYLKLGLIRPARELLKTSDPTIVNSPEWETIHQSLGSLNAPPIPWEQATTQFETNLQAIKERGVDGRLIRSAWTRASRRYEWFRDANDQDQVRRRGPNGHGSWVPALQHHARTDEQTPLPEDITEPTPGPYLFHGLGLGGYFERLYQASKNTFHGFSCALLVVEPDPAALGMIFHLRDWGGLLGDPRVLLFFGPEWPAQLSRAWRDQPDLSLPRNIFTTRPRNAVTGEDVSSEAPTPLEIVHATQSERADAIAATRAKVIARYVARDLAYWAKRFDDASNGRDRPLRILAAVSRHTTFLQYSMRDSLRALQALGHECRLLTEQHPFEIVSSLTFQRAFWEFDPDLFFVFDHLRPEFGDIVPSHLPILTWDQDQLPHAISEENIRGIAPQDFVVGCSKTRCIEMRGQPEQFLNARVPTCPEQFSGEPLSDAEIREYSCDISYVSHASQTPRAFHEEHRQSYTDDFMRRLLDVMFELMPGMITQFHVPGSTIVSALLNEAMRRIGTHQIPGELKDRLLNWYAWRLGDRVFRHTALEWVAEWARGTGRSFRIYGTGWDRHPTLAEFARGPAANGRELLCVHRASKINLQLMPAGFIHQRALDGLSSGGFFITRYAPRDLQGRSLHTLTDRIRALGITDTGALLRHSDVHVRRLLQEICGQWLPWVDPNDRTFLIELLVTEELTFPDEVFPRFREIVFDSRDQFRAIAQRFSEDDTARREIARDMREVVVQRFSYRAAMSQFLDAMRTYLGARAG